MSDHTPPGSERWEVVAVNGDGAVRVDVERLNRLLREGWEPFAATPNTTGGYRYHLRKQVPASGEGGTDE